MRNKGHDEDTRVVHRANKAKIITLLPAKANYTLVVDRGNKAEIRIFWSVIKDPRMDKATVVAH